MKPSIGSMKTVALKIMCVLASATVAGLDTLAGTGAGEREGCLATEVYSAAANLAGEGKRLCGAMDPAKARGRGTVLTRREHRSKFGSD
jgi:hypothetical protein